MSSEIQFCNDCSNLLYPKEDRQHKQLIFLCRSCSFLQYADPNSANQNCVDRLNYNFRSKEDVNSYIVQGLGHDPTLPRAPNWLCPKCQNLGAVYFQLPERVAEEAMTLVFVCANCTFYQVKGKEVREKEAENLDILPEEEEGEEGDEEGSTLGAEQFSDGKRALIETNEEQEEDDEALFGVEDDGLNELGLEGSVTEAG